MAEILTSQLRQHRILGIDLDANMGDLFAPSHILLIIIVALLLFGPKKLPELGRAFGKMLKEFKAGVQGVMSDDDKNERENQPVHQLEQKKEEPKETKRLPD